MSFVRALTARVFRNKRKDREELDIWRLYHFISYRKQISEGAKQAADLEYPNQRASYKKQYSMVHSAVTQQVSLLSRYRYTQQDLFATWPNVPISLCGRGLFDPRRAPAYSHGDHGDTVWHCNIRLQVISLLNPESAAAAPGLAPPSPDTVESQQAGSNFSASPSPAFELILSEPPSTENPIPGVPLIACVQACMHPNPSTPAAA
jgi:hypothetical protein